MADGIAMFSEAAAAKIAEVVRRELARNQNDPGRRGDNRWGDNERIIDGVADGASIKGGYGECTPTLEPNSANIKYYNSLGPVADGDDIVIGFSHRSGVNRTSGGEPVSWILLAAACEEA